MANRMTMKQYQEVKNEEYTIVKFNMDGRRVMTHGGLSAVKVVEEMINHRGALVTLVINNKDLPNGRIGSSWRIEDYEEYFKMQKKLF